MKSSVPEETLSGFRPGLEKLFGAIVANRENHASIHSERSCGNENRHDEDGKAGWRVSSAESGEQKQQARPARKDGVF